MTASAAYRLEVFGARAELGNPAVVVLETPESTDLMQAIAAKAAVSDTAFVWPGPAPSQFRIRWFTPAAETTLCGHATLAAARLLRERYALDERQPIVFYGKGAPLTVTREGGLDWLALPTAANQAVDWPRNPIVEALQIWGSETELKLPLELTPEQDLIIPLSEAADIYQIEPDMEQLAALGRGLHMRGFCLVSRQHRDKAANFSLRFFAPHFGIPEDPATGSAVGPLARYAIAHGWVKQPASPVRLLFEQGDVTGRSCRLHVELTGDRLRVGGLTSAPASVAL